MWHKKAVNAHCIGRPVDSSIYWEVLQWCFHCRTDDCILLLFWTLLLDRLLHLPFWSRPPACEHSAGALLFLFYKIIFASPCPLHFYMPFQISSWILIEIALKRCTNFGRICSFTWLSLLIHKHGTTFHLFSSLSSRGNWLHSKLLILWLLTISHCGFVYFSSYFY